MESSWPIPFHKHDVPNLIAPLILSIAYGAHATSVCCHSNRGPCRLLLFLPGSHPFALAKSALASATTSDTLPYRYIPPLMNPFAKPRAAELRPDRISVMAIPPSLVEKQSCQPLSIPTACAIVSRRYDDED